MVTDVLRMPYKSSMNITSDQYNPIQGQWVFAPPGAKPFPYPNNFTARNVWDSEDAADWGLIGEVEQVTTAYYPYKPRYNWTGQDTTITADQALNGFITSDFHNVTYPAGENPSASLQYGTGSLGGSCTVFFFPKAAPASFSYTASGGLSMGSGAVVPGGLPYIYGCSSLSSGACDRFKITFSGITNGACPVCATYNKTSTLTWSASCTWLSPTFGGCGGSTEQWGLSVAGHGTLTVSLNNSNGIVDYAASTSTWDGKSNLTLTKSIDSGGCSGFPTSLVLSPA